MPAPKPHSLVADGLAILTAVIMLALLGAPAGAATSTTVSTGKVKGIGTVLVDPDRMTLYTLSDDSGDAVPCTGACVQAWPALTVEAGEEATAPKRVKGIATTNDGAVTYRGKPLYTFAGDTSAGEATGNRLRSFGGTWKVVPIKVKAKSKSATSTSGAPRYGY
jgi:predicted lipoprotein with Yx(FWY)xxD motif